MSEQTYYDKAYSDFSNPAFSRQWATACALMAGYGTQSWGNALEFGAGLGQNLCALSAREKWAVDINQASEKACTDLGLRWESSLEAVPDHHFDLLLSHHSLEHVPDPFAVLTTLKKKAVPDAQLFVVVPIEDDALPKTLDTLDLHQHLYTWNANSLKNLCLRTGWQPISLHRNCGRGLHASLPLAVSHPLWFQRLRRFADRFLPVKTGQIVIRCRPA